MLSANKELKARFGVEITGPGGGSWCIDVDGTTVNIEETSTDACPTVFIFKPSDFVLSTYQRMRGGTVRGDEQLARENPRSALQDLEFR